MQGQGRGSSGAPPGYGDRFGVNCFPASDSYGYWGYGASQPLPPPPPLPPSPPPPRPAMHSRGVPRPPMPLGVQGGGILKRPVGPGPFPHVRGHARGYNARAWSGRGRRNLTKEALDADLDEWRLKDKRFAGHSLDTELHDYWSQKETIVKSKVDVLKSCKDAEYSPKKVVQKHWDSDPIETITPRGGDHPPKDVNHIDSRM